MHRVLLFLVRLAWLLRSVCYMRKKKLWALCSCSLCSSMGGHSEDSVSTDGDGLDVLSGLETDITVSFDINRPQRTKRKNAKNDWRPLLHEAPWDTRWWWELSWNFHRGTPCHSMLNMSISNNAHCNWQELKNAASSINGGETCKLCYRQTLMLWDVMFPSFFPKRSPCWWVITRFEQLGDNSADYALEKT